VHAARLKQTAGARGIADGELANLIRVAAGSERVPDDRAAGQLAVLLARVTEPVAKQTLDLIDMLHPVGGKHHEGTGETVRVDLAALDPDQGGTA